MLAVAHHSLSYNPPLLQSAPQEAALQKVNRLLTDNQVLLFPGKNFFFRYTASFSQSTAGQTSTRSSLIKFFNNKLIKDEYVLFFPFLLNLVPHFLSKALLFY